LTIEEPLWFSDSSPSAKMVSSQKTVVGGGSRTKISHPQTGDVVRNPPHVACYGTAFEGTISLRINDDDASFIAEGTAQGASKTGL
jgi:hypothetical protein